MNSENSLPLKARIFNIIQIGDKSNRISRAFDIFITVVIFSNIVVTFLQTFSGAVLSVRLFPRDRSCYPLHLLHRIYTPDLDSRSALSFQKQTAFQLCFLISFDGIIDFLTILPFFFLSGFVIFRMLRVARIFHLFRLNSRYDSFNVITTVLYEKRNQIISSVFIVVILMLASSLCMYSVEHDAQPDVFRNAFSGIWWSMSTLLTVGYGDIYPITTLGKVMAICIAYLGVGAVAIPTGIISAGFVEQYQRK
ncbi:MAG: ion transporter [Lachnospiraceae bacterium]